MPPNTLSLIFIGMKQKKLRIGEFKNVIFFKSTAIINKSCTPLCTFFNERNLDEFADFWHRKMILKVRLMSGS